MNSPPESGSGFLRRLKRTVIVNYGVPVLSVVATVLVAHWLDLYLKAAPVSLFICAVMFSAWFGGFGPGLVATVLSILAFQYYFVPPIYSIAVERNEIPRAIVFALAAFFVGSLSARQRSATRRCARASSASATIRRRRRIGSGRLVQTTLSPRCRWDRRSISDGWRRSASSRSVASA